MIQKYVDKDNNFFEIFNSENGHYIRSGVIKNNVDTNVDPFMRNFPSLLDIGIMGHCNHAKTGICNQAGVQCYQGGSSILQDNMTLDNYKRIIDQIKGKTFQVALGGRGDPNKHEKFEEILKYTKDNFIVPNYTTSGFCLTNREVEITKKYCGAVAVSEYFSDHTYNAINRFVDEGCIVNIHYVLSNKSIDKIIERLKSHEFPKGINAVIFLLHKPVGLGSQDNCLNINDPNLKTFFNLIDNWKGDFQIGFDSCSIPGILNFTNNINRDSIDSCEGGRYSAYISSDMKMVPCSFDSERKWGIDLNKHSVNDAWNSSLFDNFRNKMNMSCSSCKDRNDCFGGCPIVDITLCNRKERT